MTPEKRPPTEYERISRRLSFYESRPAEELRLFLDPAICVFCDHPLAAHEASGRCTVPVFGIRWACVCLRSLYFNSFDLAYDPPTHTVVEEGTYLWVCPDDARVHLQEPPPDPRIAAWRDLAASRPEGMPIHHYIQALKRALVEAANAVAGAPDETPPVR